MSKRRFATRAVHVQPPKDAGRSRAIVTPIVQSASFAFEDTEDLAVALAKPGTHYAYTRVGNPTVDALERVGSPGTELEFAL